jgi:hypothetical protein
VGAVGPGWVLASAFGIQLAVAIEKVALDRAATTSSGSRFAVHSSPHVFYKLQTTAPQPVVAGRGG